EFQDTHIHTRGKTQTSFVRTYCRVHLNTISAVYLNFSFVVYPSNTKRYRSFRFGHSQQKILTIVNILLINVRDNGFCNFSNGLQKLWLMWISSLHLSHKIVNDFFHAKTL